MTSATQPVDVLRQSRMDTLRQAVARLSDDSSDDAWALRNCLWQAMADINCAWITRQTEEILRIAESMLWRSP